MPGAAPDATPELICKGCVHVKTRPDRTPGQSTTQRTRARSHTQHAEQGADADQQANCCKVTYAQHARNVVCESPRYGATKTLCHTLLAHLLRVQQRRRCGLAAQLHRCVQRPR